MGTFGQSITPKVYRDTTRKQHTKRSLCHRVAKAFDAVGMKFMLGPSSYNVLDPANEEFTNSGTPRPMHFFFEFPTNETFLLQHPQNGVQVFKPVVVINAPTSSSTSSESQADENRDVFYINCGFVPNMPIYDASVFYDLNRIRYSIDGWNISNASQYVNTCDTRIYQLNWDNGNGISGGTATYLDVRHVLCSLSKAGLYIGIGNQNDPIVNTNYLSNMWLFAGDRLPNRGLSPVNDTYLNYIFPIMTLNFEGVNNWNLPGGWVHPRLPVLAMQGPRPDYNSFYSNNSGGGPIGFVYCGQERADFAYDLTSLDRGIRPRFSPIIDISGAPRNVLLNGLIAPNTEIDDLTKGPIFQNLNDPSEQYANWEQCFYAPGFRTTDPTAPNHQIVIDPSNSKEWLMVPFSSSLSVCKGCLDVTGYSSILTTSPSRSYTGWDTFNVDFSAMSISAGSWIAPGAGIPFEIEFLTAKSGTAATGSNSTFFNQVPSQNYFEGTINGGVSGTTEITLAFRPPVGYDMNWEYEFSCSASLRHTSGTPGANNRLIFRTRRQTPNDGDGWIDMTTYNSVLNADLTATYTNYGPYRANFGEMRSGEFGNNRPGISATCRATDTVTTPGAARGTVAFRVILQHQTATNYGLSTARVGNFSVRARRYV
jgi:hypothetical protein